MYNHTGLQGRLTADPELRHTPSGVAITSFRLASDTGRKTKDGQKITNFIDCVAWRAQAEFVSKYLTKGRLVLVEGELTSRNYEDKDGNHRKATEITVSSVHFCDSKKDGAGAGHQDTGGDFADYPDSSGDFTEVDDNGDLPFYFNPRTPRGVRQQTLPKSREFAWLNLLICTRGRRLSIQKQTRLCSIKLSFMLFGCEPAGEGVSSWTSHATKSKVRLEGRSA